jgi:hypothetical protein
MLTLILGVVVLLMACVLLAPATVNNIMHPGLPKELRPPASRLVLVPIIVIFVFGTFMFDSIAPFVTNKTALLAGQSQHLLVSAAGLFFLLFGAFACLWPSRFMRLCSPRLRLIDERSVQEREMSALARVARGFGILFLLGSAFLLRGWFR